MHAVCQGCLGSYAANTPHERKSAVKSHKPAAAGRLMRPAQHVGCLSRQFLAYVATACRDEGTKSAAHMYLKRWLLGLACFSVLILSLCHLLCLSAEGLFDIMAPSFGHVDLHLERAKAGVRRR